MIATLAAARLAASRRRSDLTFATRRRSGTVADGSAVSGGSSFCLADYDAVGFDLDNTLARYRLAELFDLIHGTVGHHPAVRRHRPHGSALPSARGFSQKGLLLDKKRGLLVKFDAQGKVDRAFRGFDRLSDAQVKQLDGEYAGLTFQSDLRPSKDWFHFADYFTAPTQAIYADMVARADPNAPLEKLWQDLMEGILSFYQPDGPRARTLLSSPGDLVHCCPDSVLAWIRNLKASGTRTFLLTGCDPCLAVPLAAYALGADWRELFDLVLVGAPKPAFFTDSSIPFKVLQEDGSLLPLSPDERLNSSTVYCGGNWPAVRDRWLGHDRRTLYVGDSLVDDIVASQGICDSVAIVEELAFESASPPVAEEKAESKPSTTAEYLTCDKWGSVFASPQRPSYFTKTLCAGAKLVVSDVTQLAKLSRDDRIPAFDNSGSVSLRGFYPSPPKSLAALLNTLF